MREPAFWQRGGVAAQLLAPAAAIFAAVADSRMKRTGARTEVPVLCIGNLTAGGTGKTPTALALAKSFLARGLKPFFLTRGYGGSLKGPVQVLQGHTARDVGDEALLLARLAPTIVASDRAAGAQAAVAAGASLIIMDDGFQNMTLEKDISLLVVDGTRGIGNGRVMPAGPLRASLGVQLARADAMLVVGAMANPVRALVNRARARGIAVLTGSLQPEAPTLTELRGQKVLAFAAIGQPEKFFATLNAAGIVVRSPRAFPDHHHFTKQEASALLDAAAIQHLTLVTTEKDIARMRGDPALAALAAQTQVLPVTMTFDDDAAVRREIIDKLLVANKPS
jgi:tetraacyldisaccharide 4'-kinase